MKKIITLPVGITALILAHAAFATTSNWTQTSLAPNVYGAGIENSNFFTTPTTVPTGTLITSTSWNIGLYTNGATVQSYHICYAARYSTTFTKCLDVSSNRVASSDFFKGLDAKGKFKITGILTGGSYPVYPAHYTTITVSYQH